MTTEEKNIESLGKDKPKKSLLKRIFKGLTIFVSCLIVLIIGIFIFIQTDLFDKWSLGIFLSKMNASLEEKESVIYAESLKGNLLKGFTLERGGITVKGDTLIKFSSIYADYDIWKLLDKGIALDNLIISQPKIFLTKIYDKNDSLKWNFAYFLETPEEKEKDTSDFELDWDISAENFEIQNGSVRILENKGDDYYIKEYVMAKLDTFDSNNLDVSELNLKLNVNYFRDSKEIIIKDLRFNTNSDFNVRQFTLNTDINKKDTITRLRFLSLITDRTDMKINELTVNGLNPFKEFIYENLKDKNVKLDLEASRFNFKDLTFFIPDIDFLDSTIGLRLIAEGLYGDLNIDKLNLNLVNSNLEFKGNIKNLDDPSKIYFDITGNNIEIDPRDTKRNLPGLDIPDYSYLGGNVRIPYLTYKGEPENFNTDFDIRTTAGNADGNAFFDLTQDVIRYKGDFSTTNFNIGKIVKDKELESNINGDFKVDAAGFDYQTAAGKLNYSLSRTKFLGQNISKSDGQLNFNRGNIQLNLTYNSDALQTKTAGKINISNPNNITYDLKGTATNLNIAAFTKDNSQKSALNFEFDINGRGFDPNSMTGKYNIKMNPSTFADFNIPATPLYAEIDQNGNIKKISMKTNFVDLSVDGSINFNTLSSVISNNIEKLKSDFTNSLTPDSLKSNDSLSYTYSAICDNIDFKYTIDIKDMAPLYSFTGGDTINLKGNLEGSLSDSCGVFYFVSNGVIREIKLSDSLLIADSASINIAVKNDISGYQLSKLEADAVIKANKLIVSKFPLDTTLVRVNFTENKNKFLIFTERDSTLNFFTEANLHDSLTVNFDTLALRYQNFLVTNSNDLIVKYNSVDSSRSIDFRQFTINSLHQKLTVAGKYSLTDSSDLDISGANIDLVGIQKLLRDETDTSNMVSGRIRYLDLAFKGVLKYPQLEFSAVSEEMSIGSTKIGRLDANVKYANDDLTSNISFYNRNNTGNFSLKGNIPMILNFSDDESDSLERRQNLADKKADLNAIARNFQLRVFQQLLPYTENLSGILEGKISLLGTTAKPVLTGKMDVNSGKVGVTLTKMNYGFFANLSTDNEKLLINNSRIFEPADKSRFISAAGYIDFTGLTLNDLYIQMSGDVKAFDKDNGDTQLGISGDLWVGSGRDKLTLQGNSDRFDLKGNLVLVKGNVVFNPFVQEAYNIYADDLNYGVIIDSVKNDSTVIKKIIRQTTDSVFIIKDQQLNPFEKVMYIYYNKDLKKEAKQSSGKFFYDIIVSTSGNVFLKFIVNEKTQQEFFGEIRTEDLNIYNYVDYSMMGRGTIYLGDNCYYKFFRKFDATGSTTFYGPITNPLLNITAEYKGYASSGTNASGEQNLEDVVIDLKVTGNASSPVLTISIDRNGVKETGSDATSDAISFLLFGKFSDQLSFSESSSFGASIGASYLSSFVSSSIEDIFPWLINTNFNYVDDKSGNVAQNTDVRFTAAIGDAVIRFGGQIFRGLANTDIVLDYPINKLLKISSLSNNLIVRFERVYDPFYSDADVTNTSGTRAGGMIYYKIKF